MDAIIRVNDLTKSYGPNLAVDHVSFDVKEGEVFGFLGPNGAGKTTTIRMMVGLTQPSSGTAFISGHDILRDPVKVKQTIGLVPETSNLYGELTSLENLIYQAELYGVARKERKDRALQLLEEFGLKEHQEKPFQKLSRGLKRRLTIATALINNPTILFLDEPTTGLDVMSARGLRKLIGDLKDLFLSLYGVEKILIDENRVRFYTKRLDQVASSIMKSLEDHGAKIQSINTLSPSLEDAFVRITGLDSELMKIDKPTKTGPE